MSTSTPFSGPRPRASRRLLGLLLCLALPVSLPTLLMPPLASSSDEQTVRRHGDPHGRPSRIFNRCLCRKCRSSASRLPAFRDQDVPDDPSYSRSNASSANRINVPLMQTPLSVQVVPRADHSGTSRRSRLEDAVKNVSGVFPGFTFGGLAEEFMMRGFNTGHLSYRDGFRVPAVCGSRWPTSSVSKW
jgi:outer membrane receptor protein involved in Fe transport